MGERVKGAAPGLSRRAVVAGAALGGAALAGGVALTTGEGSKPSAMLRRQLGRTGLEVSEVGFGGFPISDPEVLLYALDRGINYVDSSHCYRGGDSESVIGRALAGRRDSFVVATKWCPHHAGQPATKQVFLDQLDASLRRLQTDHVDVLFNHEVGRQSDRLGVERLKNPEMLAAWESARRAGKARFLGVSGHDGDLSQVVGYAIDSRQFDVVLCRYSFLDYPEQQDWIERAAAAGVGFVAMKTLAGAKGADLDSFRRAEGRQTTFKQAALKWVLSNRKVSNLIISISTRRQVDEYAAASGAPLTAADGALLAEYAGLFSREVCRFCNACEPACPDDVRIADVLRFSMYFHEYGESERAKQAYAGLLSSERATHCSSCGGFCEASCGYDLPVKRLLLRAEEALASRLERS